MLDFGSGVARAARIARGSIARSRANPGIRNATCRQAGDAFYPLLDSVALDDIVVTYRDMQTGWDADLHLDRLRKTRRIANLTTRFSIEGDLARPRVNVSASGAAARTIGEIVLTPVNLLGRLLPFVNDRGNDATTPCISVEVAELAP